MPACSTRGNEVSRQPAFSLGPLERPVRSETEGPTCHDGWMDSDSAAIIERLSATRVIDITTVGRRSGDPARIEIWWFHVGERFIITGTPGPRDWYANLRADPSIVIHTAFGDFDGRAVPVTDPELRRRVMTHPDLSWYRSQAELDALVATSPMVEIVLSVLDRPFD